RQPIQPLTEAAATVLNQLGLRSIGVESAHLTVGDFEALRGAAPALSWKPARDRVERLRQIKESGEVEQIRRAIRVAERAFAMFRAMLQAENTEKDLADALEMYIRRA